MISLTPILNDTIWRRVAAQAAWYPPPSYESKVYCLIRWPDYFAYSALLLPLVSDSCCEGSHSKIDNIALQDKNPKKRVFKSLGLFVRFRY